MKSVFKKSRLFIMLASLLGVMSPMAQAADLVPVQPTVAVVDEQHQAISWANLMLNGFLQHHEGASINEISFDATDTVVTLTVGGFDKDGVYKAVFTNTANEVKDEKVGKLTKTLEKTAFDPSTILPPAVAVNFAYAQAEGKATSLLSWAVKTDKGTPQYTVVFATKDKKTITVVFDAVSGKLLSVTK